MYLKGKRYYDGDDMSFAAVMSFILTAIISTGIHVFAGGAWSGSDAPDCPRCWEAFVEEHELEASICDDCKDEILDQMWGQVDLAAVAELFENAQRETEARQILAEAATTEPEKIQEKP